MKSNKRKIQNLHTKINKRFGLINRLAAGPITCKTQKKIAMLENKNLMAHIKISEIRAEMEEL